MKIKSILSVALLITTFQSVSWSCDQILQPYPRDCKIQDQFRSLRKRLKAQNVDINEVAEYRALRFIDRKSWETAKANQVGPRWIYKIMPDTWDIWDSGVRAVEKDFSIKNATLADFSEIHKHLLTKKIQDHNTDMSKAPGRIRMGNDDVNGSCYKKICNNGSCGMDQVKLDVLNALKGEEPQMQQLWEIRSGITFTDLINQTYGTNVKKAITYAPLNLIMNPGPECDGFWVDYLPSSKVRDHLAWWIVYVNDSLIALNRGKAAQSAIELAADAQKWMVSIHPFADGNGRFSRMLQDLILTALDLPVAPAGDLANDVIATRYNYRVDTYNKMEKMLSKLSHCADYYEGRSDGTYDQGQLKMMCSEVSQLSGYGQK